MLKLKGSMRVLFFTLEVDQEFKNCADVEKFIKWADSLRVRYPPKRETG